MVCECTFGRKKISSLHFPWECVWHANHTIYRSHSFRLIVAHMLPSMSTENGSENTFEYELAVPSSSLNLLCIGSWTEENSVDFDRVRHHFSHDRNLFRETRDDNERKHLCAVQTLSLFTRAEQQIGSTTSKNNNELSAA